jgi:hypothetical protein
MGVKSYPGGLEMSAKLVDAGIDYIRVTSEDKREKGRMLDYYRAVRGRDEKLGYEEKTGGAFGFLGKRVRHALYGDKGTWGMVQVSGYEAKGSAKLARAGTQATRIDLQLTFWVGENEVESCIRSAYDAACSAVNLKKRPPSVRLIESRHKAQTVYLGARASDVFFRIYDKFEESKKEEYRGCVRFELELKGRLAKALWQKWVDGTGGIRASLEMVIAMLSERGVQVPDSDLDNQDILCLKKQQTSIEATAAWLATQVTPTIKRLSGSHGWIFPFSLLFQSSMSDVDRRRIMQLLAIAWAS